MRPRAVTHAVGSGDEPGKTAALRPSRPPENWSCPPIGALPAARTPLSPGHDLRRRLPRGRDRPGRSAASPALPGASAAAPGAPLLPEGGLALEYASRAKGQPDFFRYAQSIGTWLQLARPLRGTEQQLGGVGSWQQRRHCPPVPDAACDLHTAGTSRFCWDQMKQLDVSIRVRVANARPSARGAAVAGLRLPAVLSKLPLTGE